jgi:hypothetical protein
VDGKITLDEELDCICVNFVTGVGIGTDWFTGNA